MNPVLNLSAADWLQLFEHFASLSLLAVGGAITTAPDMHRYLVSQLGWLSDSQFTSSIALAQAAPGPNILFVALMGWNVGLNASQGAAWWMQGALALTGVCVAMLGIMLPSSILTYTATRWAHQHRDMLAICFQVGHGTDRDRPAHGHRLAVDCQSRSAGQRLALVSVDPADHAGGLAQPHSHALADWPGRPARRLGLGLIYL